MSETQSTPSVSGAGQGDLLRLAQSAILHVHGTHEGKRHADGLQRLAAERDALTATVERVRTLADQWEGYGGQVTQECAALLRETLEADDA